MLKNFLIKIDDKLGKSIDALKTEFSKLILNKLNVNLIRALYIIYDNEKLFFDQICVISIDSGNCFLIKPFDKKYIPFICTEIIKLKLDLNPIVTSDSIKVFFPLVTMERRHFFLKKSKQVAEDTKVSIRNIRKIINQEIKEFLKSNKISDDEEKKFFNDIQKRIDSNIEVVDSLLKKKEKDLLNV